MGRVEKYYVRGERYDWVKDTRNLETRFHNGRAKKILDMVNGEEFEFTGDLGCGTGLITQSMKGRILGIDINRWNLDRTRERVDGEFIQASLTHIPITDQALDQVVISEVLEHVVNPENVVEEIRRILRPGGRIVGSVPSKSPVWKIRFLLSTTHPHSEPFHRNYSKRELHSFFKGFLVTSWLGNYFLNRFFYARKR